MSSRGSALSHLFRRSGTSVSVQVGSDLRPTDTAHICTSCSSSPLTCFWTGRPLLLVKELSCVMRENALLLLRALMADSGGQAKTEASPGLKYWLKKCCISLLQYRKEEDGGSREDNWSTQTARANVKCCLTITFLTSGMLKSGEERHNQISHQPNQQHWKQLGQWFSFPSFAVIHCSGSGHQPLQTLCCSTVFKNSFKLWLSQHYIYDWKLHGITNWFNC